MTRHAYPAWCILAGLVCGACAPPAAQEAARPLVIATGSTDGIYYAIGTQLARAYARQMPDLRPIAIATAASGHNVRAIESDQADVAFALGDVTYTAYTRGTADAPEPHRGVRAIAVLYVNVLHILVRADSDITSVADLRGRSVAVGRSVATGQGGRSLTLDTVSEAHGIARDSIAFEWLTFSGIAKQLGDSSLDSAFLSSGYPVQTVIDAAATFGVRLLPIDRTVAARVRAAHPFFRAAIIPAGTYPGQPETVETLGIDNLLLCRDDLDEELVYRLTRGLFESLPEIGETILAARLVDLERATTTPIPLHPGAARYYRERELLRW